MKFCRHQYERLDDEIHTAFETPYAVYKCRKCGKKDWFDIMTKKPNKYVFKEHNIENISDGSHTFKELYYHRMLLFSILCNSHKDKAWKSKKHADGKMFKGYFIVGITTEEGDFSYHYKKEYYDMFNVKELRLAPEWDGHLSKDITRLLSLINKED